MKTIRAFFAIAASKELHNYLLGVLQSVKQEIPKDVIHWVNIEHLHITLHFIAQLKLIDLVPLSHQVSQVLMNIPCFQLNLGPLEWFPTLRHPKILSLVVEPHDNLCKLVNSIAQSVNALHYPLDARAFRGHMTLGRVHHYHKNQDWLSRIKLGAVPPLFVDKVHLLESKLGQEKAIYSTLTQFKLGSI